LATGAADLSDAADCQGYLDNDSEDRDQFRVSHLTHIPAISQLTTARADGLF